MKSKKAILAGGSGFIGSALSQHLSNHFEEVVILSRQPAPKYDNVRTVIWDGRTAGEWTSELSNATLLVNLTGKNVNCRYTEKNKNAILNSRLNSTEVLGHALRNNPHPSLTWIQLTSATIYRHAMDHPMDEATGEYGAGFSENVCQQWEACFHAQQQPNVRQVALRTAIVLGKNGGALPRILTMTRFGLGGKQGDGRQMVSWIHEQDLVEMIYWAFSNSVEGTFNAAAPSPLANKEFMRAIRRSLRAPFGLPAPAWLLELGAFMIGTETELILKSRWVLPARVISSGFQFRYPTIDLALQEIIR